MKHQAITLGKLCAKLGLHCPQEHENLKISGVATLEEAATGDLCFLSNMKYAAQAEKTTASAIFVKAGTVFNTKAVLIECDDPYLRFALHLRGLESQFNPRSGQSPTAIIDPGAKIDPTAIIATAAIIEADVEIGPHTYIGVGTKILKGSKIGAHVNIEAGVVIGSEGFGFAPDAEGKYHRIPQLGNVIIDDFVSIGANTTVDRAALGSTRIGEGTKIDNLCMIAHNVVIGKHNVIAAQSGVAGSTTIGNHCMIGGQVGIIGHLNLGDNVKIYAQSGVMNDVPSNKTIFGSPALEHRHFLKSFAAFKRQGK
jgi:UDP-3-O-[3-hydroxymyristoyl] glucosamine N-acyltransferase